MSTYEAAYKSLLQGVSQQLPEERLPGQVTSQTNMISDPVTNLRSRPGVLYRKDWAWDDATDSSVLGWFTDIAGQRVHILLNTNTGNIRILGEDWGHLADLEGGDYLTAANPSSIRATAVGTEFFLGNTAVQPALDYVGGGFDPANAGFFYIVTGAFSKTYSVALVAPDTTIEASYTTPSGSSSGDAALATPEYIAEQLYSQLAGNSFTAVRLNSVSIPENYSGKASVVVQRNTGSVLFPTWVTQTLPLEVPASDIANGRIRVRYQDTTNHPSNVPLEYRSNAVSLEFQVEVLGSWVSTLYEIVPYSTARYTNRNPYTLDTVLKLAQFTDVAPVSGDATLFIDRTGPYVYATRAGGVSVNTAVGSAYLVASKGGMVSSAGELPARLPASADGYICRVGITSPQYFRYDAASTEWKETSAYGSPTAVVNVPVSIMWTEDDGWQVNTTEFAGRLAGDAESNKLLEFMQFGISGISTYQGRLVLLSGPMVALSAVGKPRQFFRTTVTSLLNSDPIEIGSGMASAAAYEWAIPFQKDLLLFSRAYQAVLPSGNAAVTPATATVVPTSTHEVDTTSSPISMGRTLMYCTPRSADFFGVLEMIPSSYTDSQYISQDATPHLPKYMGGKCRFAVSSGVASMALFAPSGDPYSLVIHEYHWDADTKVQQAWHQWTFQYPVATAYFSSDMITVVFVRNGRLVMGTVDPRAGALNAASERRPFLDLNVSTTIVDNRVDIPEWMRDFDEDIGERLRLIVLSGGLAGELVGATLSADGEGFDTVPSHPSGSVGIGIPYYRGFIPTPPTVRDYKDGVIHSGKATLLRYMIGTRDSSEFNVVVADAYSGSDAQGVATLSWSSPELELGRGLYANQAISLVPCRTDLRSTSMEVFTEGAGELNITSLEYVAKFHPKITRR